MCFSSVIHVGDMSTCCRYHVCALWGGTGYVTTVSSNLLLLTQCDVVLHGVPVQVIAFFDALMRCKESGVSRVLVLCPVNTVNNWRMEFCKWIPYLHCDYGVSGCLD
jgi:hypothetical protein